jgi:hypothetical protein
MPQIYEYFGFIFRFYSDEHYPIHVHVEKGEYESIYDLIIVNGLLVELKHRKKRGVEAIPEHDRQKAEKFIRVYYKNIVEKWTNYFVLNIPVKTTKITKKI